MTGTQPCDGEGNPSALHRDGALPAAAVVVTAEVAEEAVAARSLRLSEVMASTAPSRSKATCGAFHSLRQEGHSCFPDQFT